MYHLPLSALTLHTLYSHDATLLKTWVAKLQTPPIGRALLNLAASHDGVGLSWCKEILSAAGSSEIVEQTTEK